MSGTENSPTGTLDERLRLGAGFAAADRPRILEALSALAPHLSGWEHDQVDLEVSLKDTEGPDQKVTLQAWLAGRAHLIATSHEHDLDHALTEVRRDLIRQIEDERSRREPRKRRKTRYRTT
jgi:ribosome-associated translation inhibitor RaiA